MRSHLDALCLQCHKPFQWDTSMPMLCRECLVEAIKLPFELKIVDDPDAKPIPTIIPVEQRRRVA